ncbi:DMT family transporter [Notoacmeibacter sp. MSK16QG-6]|uniref:DMT family transporter n=1 Tax=Notoacmeibacter sp. MSK16QG-6 TaxID=2957982 RepID=UPI0020A1E0C3|nr:DMT family transporter [Notoacmeibacter sp. MSK16QG-6]MCP1198468.1 DMT family transporter [Notoacmeibacter sp. MSK16QG-6]
MYQTGSRSALTGYGLALVGGLSLTVDIPTLRLADADLASALLFRSMLEVGAALLIWLVWRTLSDKAPALIPGWPGVLVSLFYGTGSIVFIVGVLASAEDGATGALLFLLATSPLLAALLVFFFLGERPSIATWVALLTVLLGVGLIAGNPTAGSHLVKICGFGSALLIAGAITVSRWSGRAMGFTPLIACVLPAMLGAALLLGKEDASAQVGSWFWLTVNGGLVLPVAFFLLAQAPRYIPAPQAALFYLLETTIAPVWLYLIFGETLSTAALVGGGLIVGAVAFDTAMQVRKSRRPPGIRPRRSA